MQHTFIHRSGLYKTSNKQIEIYCTAGQSKNLLKYLYNDQFICLASRPTILITVGQGPIALAVGAGGGGLDIFTLICPFSSFSLSLGDGSI